MADSKSDLEKKQEKAAKLREELVEAVRAREEAERNLVDGLAESELDVEIATLEAQVAREKELAKPKVVQAGVATNVDAAKAAMARATGTAPAVGAGGDKTDKEN